MSIRLALLSLFPLTLLSCATYAQAQVSPLPPQALLLTKKSVQSSTYCKTSACMLFSQDKAEDSPIGPLKYSTFKLKDSMATLEVTRGETDYLVGFDLKYATTLMSDDQMKFVQTTFNAFLGGKYSVSKFQNCLDQAERQQAKNSGGSGSASLGVITLSPGTGLVLDCVIDGYPLPAIHFTVMLAN